MKELSEAGTTRLLSGVPAVLGVDVEGSVWPSIMLDWLVFCAELLLKNG